MSTEQRIDSLTGIRGLAALLVVYCHLSEYKFFSDNPLYPGEVGVMLFFTLSGFLMSFLYGEKDFNYSSVARYVISRFSRIAPAYLFIVVASYLIYNLVDGQFVFAITNGNLLRHLMFSGNVSALWSIPPEVQFYVVFIGIWLALWAFRTKANAAFLIIMLAVIFTLMAYRENLPGTFVGSKMHYFFAGAVFGLLRSRATSGASLAPVAALQLGVIIVIGLVLADVIHLDFGTKKHFYSTLETALFSGIVIFVFSFDTGLSKRLLGNRLISMCGECSFSMYLLNYPVIYFASKLIGDRPHTYAMAAATITAILVLAWTMYRTIEIPGSALLRKLGTRLLLNPRPAMRSPAVETTAALHPLDGASGVAEQPK